MVLEEVIEGFSRNYLNEVSKRSVGNISKIELNASYKELSSSYQLGVKKCMIIIYDCYNRIYDYSNNRVLFPNDLIMFCDLIKKTPIKIKHLLVHEDINRGIHPTKAINRLDIEETLKKILNYLANVINRLLDYINE